MKYLVALILSGVVIILTSPIMLIKWDSDGLEQILEGISDMCGV